jgi:hypothetical protein
MKSSRSRFGVSAWSRISAALGLSLALATAVPAAHAAGEEYFPLQSYA